MSDPRPALVGPWKEEPPEPARLEEITIQCDEDGTPCRITIELSNGFAVSSPADHVVLIADLPYGITLPAVSPHTFKPPAPPPAPEPPKEIVS